MWLVEDYHLIFGIQILDKDNPILSTVENRLELTLAAILILKIGKSQNHKIDL